MSSNCPSSNTNANRLLSSEEFAVVEWLLQHGNGEHSRFLHQLQQARVVELCPCGCASISFSINGKRPKKEAHMNILADYQWQDDRGHLFGAFVFERDGLLAGLELWSIDGQSTPATMPLIDRLVPFGSTFSS